MDAKTVLEWDKIINHLKNNAETEGGKIEISQLMPLSQNEIKNNIERISEIKKSILENYSFHFGGVRNILSACRRSSKGSLLSFDEIFNIRQTIKATTRIKKFIKKYSSEFLKISELSEQIDSVMELDILLTESLTDNCELSTVKYPNIAKLQDNIDRTQREIISKINSLFTNNAYSSIFQENIHDQRNGRYVVLIKSNMKGKIKGSVHDISSSGQTLYLEPDNISSLNTSLILKRIELEKAIEQILYNLTDSISKFTEELINNQSILSSLDRIKASAKLSNSLQANPFQISDKNELILFKAGHPLLILNQENVVMNNVELTPDKNAIIITGANTGGKTVMLKTAGLCVLMAIHGLHIPASADSTIGIFNKIFADIGDDQNLSESLSTFSGQIVSINNMIKEADSNTLILIDEIMSGTNPVQGSALAESVLEDLAQKGAKIIATTHYQQLNTIPLRNERFRNASVSFNLENLQPTYNLHTDIPGASYTLEIASNYGMPDRIINNAKNKLSSLELSTDILVEKLHTMENQLAEEKERVENLKLELNNEKNKYNQLNIELKNNIKSTEEYKGVEFLDEIRRLKEKVSDHISSLQNANISDAGHIQKDLIETEKIISQKVLNLKNDKDVDGFVNFNPDTAKAGDLIFVKELEKTGKLFDFNPKKNEATIMLGILKAKYKFHQILIKPSTIDNRDIKKITKTYAQKTKQKMKDIPFTMQTQFNTSDLRGMRVDAAILKLEKDLDSFSYSGIDSAVIIHGHGTGALKEAVRNHIKNLNIVNSFRSGQQQEGGDGVTIALLK